MFFVGGQIHNQSSSSSSSSTENLEPLQQEVLDLPDWKSRCPVKYVFTRRKENMAKSSDGDNSISSSSESAKEAGSNNKRKHLSECASQVPVEEMLPSLTEFPRYELLTEKLANEIGNIGPSVEDDVKEYILADWDDPFECQFEELLSDTLYTTFRETIKEVAEHGYSEEAAEQAILKRGMCYGDKDLVSDTVDSALRCLEGEQEEDFPKLQLFDNLQELVRYTMLEMVYVLKEIKTSLSIGEAMYSLLISDLSLKEACVMETDYFGDLRNVAVTGGSANSSVVSQIKSELKTCETNPLNTGKSGGTSKPTDPRKSQTKIPSDGESSNLASVKTPVAGCISGSTTAGHNQTSSQPTTGTEDASGSGKKCCSGNSKRELLRQKTLHMERSRGRMPMSRGAFKSKITSGGFVMDKKTAAYMKNVAYKENNPVVTKVQVTSATLPVKDVSAADGKNSKLVPTETKPTAGSKVNTVPPPKTPDYYAGIPYDKSAGKYVPQNNKDELLLELLSKKETLEKELQHWTDWTYEKIRQAARRLGKDKEELQGLREEKEEVKKLLKAQETQEENTLKRISEMEYALSNATRQTEMARSTVDDLEMINSELKQELMSTKILALGSVVKLQEAKMKERETLKKVESCDSEKAILLENLKSCKNKAAELNKDVEKAKGLCHQNEVLWKQEEKEKDKVLAQASSLRKEREQLETVGKEEGDKIKQKADIELQKYNNNIKNLEEQISKMKMECESSRIAALREGANMTAKTGHLIPNTLRRLPVFQEISRSESMKEKNRECIMCMSEDHSVVFLPCAHQILCEDCNVRHEKEKATNCPLCRAHIQTRFQPRFVKMQNK